MNDEQYSSNMRQMMQDHEEQINHVKRGHMLTARELELLKADYAAVLDLALSIKREAEAIANSSGVQIENSRIYKMACQIEELAHPGKQMLELRDKVYDSLETLQEKVGLVLSDHFEPLQAIASISQRWDETSHVDDKVTVDVVEDGVYISEGGDEIVAWVESEVRDDPYVAFVIANALKIGYEQGAEAIRKLLRG